METTKTIPAATHGQTAAAKIFNIADTLEISETVLHLITARLRDEAAKLEAPAWLSVASITDVNKAVAAINKLIADMQALLASHGEGWAALQDYAVNGTDTALKEVEAGMRDYLKRAKVPQVLHKQHLAAARASVDVGYYDTVARSLAALRRAGVQLEDINIEEENWRLSDGKALTMYADHIERLTPALTQDLVLWAAVRALESILASHGIDIDNLRRACPDGVSAELLAGHYSATCDERITAADRDAIHREAESRMHQLFG